MIKIINNLHVFFIPPKHWREEDEFRKAKMLVNTLLLSILFGFFYFFNTIFFEMHYIMYNMIFCVCTFSFSLILFKYGASRTIVANIFSAAALFCTVFDIYFSKGLFGWSFAWLSMSPVLALLLLSKEYGYFWLCLSAALGIAIGLLSLNGFDFPNDINPKFFTLMTVNAGIGVILIMFFIASVMYNASNRSLQKLSLKNQEIQWEKAIAEQQRYRAEESEKFKQQFLANMSHEIRTPMNTIIGLTNLMMEQNLTEEQIKNHLKIIQISSSNLQNIITDVLDISKIEAGKVELEKIEFSIKNVVDSVYQTSLYRAAEKKIQLHLNYDNTIATLSIGDPTKLTQVLSNLVSNAIKFTHDGSVTMKVKKEDAKVVFTVADTGIGMTPEQVNVIFEPFRQADASTSRKYGGTGLGLFISKQLLALQKSELIIDTAPGKGTSLSFAMEYPESVNKSTEKAIPTVTDEMLAQLKGLKILLAEDNEFNRIVAIETLEFKIPGVTIDTAWNGQEAIDKLNRHDLVLMDIQMPEVDGYDATRKIRNDLPAPFNSVPIIALTASIIESDYKKCLALGMNAVIAKPFNTNELLLTIYNLVKGKPATNNIKPTKDETQETKTTNIETLRFFCENDNERVKKYIRMYLESTPKNLGKLKKSLEEKDFINVKNTAHVLKTHLKYMGMKETAQIAENIEKKCNGGYEIKDLQSLLSSMENMCIASYSELNEYV